MEDVAILVGFSVVLAISLFFVLWVAVIPEWLLRARCRTRIASIRTSDITSFGRSTRESVGDNMRFSNKKVCSGCKKFLEETDFPIQGIWFTGALVEYLKNTPTFLAVIVSIAALALSVIALFQDKLF